MWNGPGPRLPPAGGCGEGVSPGQGSPDAAPGTLIRTLEGHITAWSPGMEQRYGYSSSDAIGQTSHQLLKSTFPRALREIEAVLLSRYAWCGGVIHHHANGGPVMAVNHWTLGRDGDGQCWLVTEVHSNLARAVIETSDHLADVLEALAHELSEPLTAIGNYVDGARHILQAGWPDLGSVHMAMAQVSGQSARGAAALRLLRDLAIAVRRMD